MDSTIGLNEVLMIWFEFKWLKTKPQTSKTSKSSASTAISQKSERFPTLSFTKKKASKYKISTVSQQLKMISYSSSAAEALAFIYLWISMLLPCILCLKACCYSFPSDQKSDFLRFCIFSAIKTRWTSKSRTVKTKKESTVMQP